MDAALCLHYGALHIPSTTNRAASIARRYSRFRPSSLSLSSKASSYRALSRHALSSPVICALNKPSTPSPNYDKDNAKKIVRVVGGASVVLACVLGIINCNYNFSPTAIAGSYERTPSQKAEQSTFILSQPKYVLDSFLKVNNYIATHKSHGRWTSTPKLELPNQPDRDSLNKLKIAVADLIKSGKSDKAVDQLRNLIQEKERNKEGIPAYEAEMELVVLLIFQGKYDEALKCNCLQGAAISTDGRVHFYKAIIYTMLDRDKDAEECWSSFVGSFSTSNIPNNPPDNDVKQKGPRAYK